MALVGIARLASQSELLATKRSVQYFELPARSILNRTKPRMPFQWTINPYRGCEFGCKYCFARYTHEFMEMDASDFDDKIYAKSAAAHLLRLAALRKLGGAGIAVGVFANPVMPGLTDGERQLDRLAKTARDAGALWFDGAPMFLMSSAQKVFLPLLEREFPALVARYRELYARGAFLGAGYKAMLRGRVEKIRERYGLEARPIEYPPELWDGEEQGELFPLQ